MMKRLIIMGVLGMGIQLGAMEGDLKCSLYGAVILGKTTEVQDLIKNGADVNSHYKGGKTVLMTAVRNGDFNMAKLLIENGAEINQVDQDGGTALLSCGLKNNQAPIYKLLIESGANVFAQDEAFGTSALHNAAAFGNENAIKILLTTIPCSERQRILEVNPETQINNLVNFQMLRLEALVALRNKYHKTARDIAIEEEYPSIADLLLLKNPTTQAWLRGELEANIMSIFNSTAKDSKL